MVEIYNNLYIGSKDDCDNNSNIAIIHACKTCHMNVLNYKKSLPQDHEHYLIYEPNIDNLYLNLVDMEKELLPRYTDQIMKEAIDFIDNNISKKSILIHCDQGMSRSPSIGLLYLAINNIISNDDYKIASQEFLRLYPKFNPGNGITKYLENNWKELITMKTN